MSGIFKDRGLTLNIGVFSEDGSEIPLFHPPKDGTVGEANVGGFGAGPDEVGAYQSALTSANLAKASAETAVEAAEKVKDAEAISNSILATKNDIDQKDKHITDSVTDFNTKYTDFSQNIAPSVEALAKDTIKIAGDIKSVQTSIVADQITVGKRLTETLSAAAAAKASEVSAQSYEASAQILKDQVDASTKNFIDNFLNYRGMWDPSTDAYPDPQGGDSIWDINLPKGLTTYTFDGISWAIGDRVFWYKNNIPAKRWVHLKSGSGIVVSNLDKLYQKIDTKNKPDGYAGLGPDGRVLPSLMPALSILDINVDHNFHERNARTSLQKGDISIIKGAVPWKSKHTYTKGDIAYIPDPSNPHSVASNKFYSSKGNFESKSSFVVGNWDSTTLKPGAKLLLGQEVVYKNKLYLVKENYTVPNIVADPSKLSKYFELDDYIDSGMYILQQNPSGQGGTSKNEDWVSFGSDFRVASFNGRVGIVVPEAGDYEASEITTKAFGTLVGSNVQDAIEDLESHKVNKAGDNISGKINIQNDLEAENIKLTGLGEESVTNASGNNLLRSGGSGNATILGNKVEGTVIETSVDPIVRVGNGSDSKFFHQGFRPTAGDVNARPDTWVPTWKDILAAPETAIRWPLWSEIGNTPTLFTGSYTALTNVPTSFTPKSHTHPWSQITQVPNQAKRWPNWNEVTNKPTIFSGNYNDLSNKPALFSGNFSQLTNVPDTATRWPSATEVGALPDSYRPDWNSIIGKPTTFAGNYADLKGIPKEFVPKAHTHAWGEVTGKPSTSTRWPTYAEVTGKPSLFSGEFADLKGIPLTASRWPTPAEVKAEPAGYSYSKSEADNKFQDKNLPILSAATINGKTEGEFVQVYDISLIAPGGNLSTASFVSWLKGRGAFTDKAQYWTCRFRDSQRAGRVDTGIGYAQLSSAFVEVIGSESNYTMKITTAGSVVTGDASAVFTHNYDGSSKSKWFKDYNSENKPTAADVGLPGLSNEVSYGNGLRITTSSGFTSIGMRDAEYTHFNTQGTKGFYFYKPLDAESITSRTNIGITNAPVHVSHATRKDYVDSKFAGAYSPSNKPTAADVGALPQGGKAEDSKALGSVPAAYYAKNVSGREEGVHLNVASYSTTSNVEMVVLHTTIPFGAASAPTLRITGTGWNGYTNPFELMVGWYYYGGTWYSPTAQLLTPSSTKPNVYLFKDSKGKVALAIQSGYYGRVSIDAFVGNSGITKYSTSGWTMTGGTLNDVTTAPEAKQIIVDRPYSLTNKPTAADVGAYTKAEVDAKVSKGGGGYTKAESDTKYLPKTAIVKPTVAAPLMTLTSGSYSAKAGSFQMISVMGMASDQKSALTTKIRSLSKVFIVVGGKTYNMTAQNVSSRFGVVEGRPGSGDINITFSASNPAKIYLNEVPLGTTMGIDGVDVPTKDLIVEILDLLVAKSDLKLEILRDKLKS